MWTRLPTLALALVTLLNGVLFSLTAGGPLCSGPPSSVALAAPASDELLSFIIHNNCEPATRAWEAEMFAGLLHVSVGETVADIGCGSGYMSFDMAARVGPRGRVLAVDVSPPAVEYVGARARALGLHNVQARLSSPDDVGLPPGAAHCALLINVVHCVYHLNAMGDVRAEEGARAFMQSVFRGLAPGGRLLVYDTDFNSDDPPIEFVTRCLVNVGFVVDPPLRPRAGTYVLLARRPR